MPKRGKLKLQRQLAASILNCGRKKVWMDPNKTAKIQNATTQKQIRKMIKKGWIKKRPQQVHSRRKGRHCCPGKRIGTANSRRRQNQIFFNRKWMLRRHLKRFRDTKLIDKHLYRQLYLKVNANEFKNSDALLKFINKKASLKSITDQGEASRQRVQEYDDDDGEDA